MRGLLITGAVNLLIDPLRTPWRVGIGQVQGRIFAVSACCKMMLEDERAEAGWFCQGCKKPSWFPFGQTPFIAPFLFLDDQHAWTRGDICHFVQAWTGLRHWEYVVNIDYGVKPSV